jgi:serine/threonine protein kinase
VKDKFPGPWQVGDIIRLEAGYAYEVREIKGGGMGQVYICIGEDDMAPFVLKTIQEKYLNSKTAIERFRWEAEVWVRLKRHRNIVRAHGTGTALGYTFVLLEYVAGDEYYGSDLSDWIRKGGLSIPLALDFACQFCSGMIHARETFYKDTSLRPPFVHRDIKPQNIMVTRDRIVKVTDFGLVKAFDMLAEDIETDIKDEFGERRHSFTKKGGVCGTFPYIAPEIWLREEPDERTDIYSFGCVLYQMFYGIPPFVYPHDDPEQYEKYENAHLNLSPKPIRDISDGINEVILKCLEKERSERYQDFSLLREALAELYYEQNKERIIFKEETEVEGEADFWLEKGNGLIHLGFNEESIGCYTRALELNPNYDFAYNSRGNAYSYLGKHERAISDYDEAIRLNPKNAFAYYNRGNAYRNLGQYERAISDYDEAIRLNPKNATAHNGRGLAYSNLGKPERAISDYDEAIKLNPKHDFAYRNRGAAYYNLGKYERAISDYDEAIRLDPKDATAYNNRGNAYYNLGKYERAISDYDGAIRLNPNEAFTYYNKAVCLQENIKKYEEALEVWEKYLEVSKDDPKQKEWVIKAMAQIMKIRGKKFLKRLLSALNLFNLLNPYKWG